MRVALSQPNSKQRSVSFGLAALQSHKDLQPHNTVPSHNAARSRYITRLQGACRWCDSLLRGFFMRAFKQRGQATVEAAICIPVLFVGILLLIQPGIVLYDRMVMNHAAAEACRVLATNDDEQLIEQFIRRRLGAIPQQSSFHVHDDACSYEIQITGGSSSATASVSIKNQLKPLPLIGAAETLLGLTNDEGNLQIEVEVQQTVQPSWTASSTAGSDSSSWVGAWMS